jgi:hypothetical protein
MHLQIIIKVMSNNLKHLLVKMKLLTEDGLFFLQDKHNV